HRPPSPPPFPYTTLFRSLYSVTAPAGVILPIRSSPSSVNHRLPSGPAAMPVGRLSAAMPLVNSLTVPVRVILPIASFPSSANQRSEEHTSELQSLAYLVC